MLCLSEVVYCEEWGGIQTYMHSLRESDFLHSCCDSATSEVFEHILPLRSCQNISVRFRPFCLSVTVFLEKRRQPRKMHENCKWWLIHMCLLPRFLALWYQSNGQCVNYMGFLETEGHDGPTAWNFADKLRK